MTGLRGPTGDVPALELRAATLAFGARRLWSEIDLRVEPGEFVAVLGSNGVGKSSLLRVLLGLLPLSAGEADVLGTPVHRGRREVAHLSQHRGFAEDAPLRARDLVRLGVDGHRWGVGGGRRTATRVAELLESVGATRYADQRLGTLSGGEQQRVRVAQALAADPAVLLCDEPLQSLDPRHQQVVADLVAAHRRDRGAAVLFVTHDLAPVRRHVDRVLELTEATEATEATEKEARAVASSPGSAVVPGPRRAPHLSPGLFPGRSRPGHHAAARTSRGTSTGNAS